MPTPHPEFLGAKGACLASFAAICAVLALLFTSRIAFALPAVGQPAPMFTGTDSNGRTVSLSDFRGKTVVLEWTNHECPFVGRHYGSGNMQALQKQATADGVVWLSIVSSAPGEQGSVTPAEANALTQSRNAAPTAVILDPSGTIGHAYDAKTTPHMFVIDPDGLLVYMGAIDDQPRNAGADPGRARNYVRDALAALKAGQPVTDAVTQPYGCSVKYKG
jgi:Peroxiredoxin